MNPDSPTSELTPHELALLACYQDGVLAPDDLVEAERLLERSPVAREILAEARALLESEPGDAATASSDPEESEPARPPSEAGSGPGPRIPATRMGWRTFLPLAAAGIAVILLLWPGGESLNLVAWSDTLARQGGVPFPFPIVRGDTPGDDLPETAGIRWVDLRIALRAGRRSEADSLARVLAASLGTVVGSGPARGRVEALIGREPPPLVEEVEATQRALVERLGPVFEEAAVLETLRRAAGAGAASLSAELVEHPSLDDGRGDDLDPGTRTRLLELCRGGLTDDELSETEATVTDLLRRRT